MKSERFIIVLLFILTTCFLWYSLSLARVVTDQLGRQVRLPDDPQRVVALAPSITEIIFALGQEHRLKGVTMYSDHPDAAQKIAKVGSYVRLDLEKIVALRPDLCIAVKDGNPKAVIERLEDLKIPVYAVDPRNLETVMDTIREIGGLLDANESAEKLIRNMELRSSCRGKKPGRGSCPLSSLQPGAGSKPFPGYFYHHDNGQRCGF
jgi:iron complex transport system substrate-binding protein